MSMLKIQHVFEIKNFICVVKAQISFIVPAWIDIAGGMNLMIHD